MSINTLDMLDKVVSHALSLGVFESVNTHEPKSAPSNGLTASVWLQSLTPLGRVSGLTNTGIRLEWRLRMYAKMTQEPQDAIDPAMLIALDTLLAAYTGDFDLAETVMMIDLLGAYGAALGSTAGYINQDGSLYRVMDVVLPIIISDVWEQES